MPRPEAPSRIPVRLLTVEQAADYLAVSVPSVRRLLARGEIPAIRLTRRLLVDLRDLDRLIERRKDPMTSPWTPSHCSTKVLA